MSKPTLCDFCGKDVMPIFIDLGYKVTVKELKHSYDGYNPWVRKTKLDVCEYCMKHIVGAFPLVGAEDSKEAA